MCHEANRAWCTHWGSDQQPEWDSAPMWQRQSAIDGVRFVVQEHKQERRVTARQLHENWVRHKQSQGWVWAKVKDASKKEHNCLLPYDELNPKERLKDKLFLGIVFAFLD